MGVRGVQGWEMFYADGGQRQARETGDSLAGTFLGREEATEGVDGGHVPELREHTFAGVGLEVTRTVMPCSRWV